MVQNEASVLSGDLSKTEIMQIPCNFMQPKMDAALCLLYRCVGLIEVSCSGFTVP